MQKISVIVPAYNDHYRATRCLDSLQETATTGHVEYIVQDDCSTNPFYIPQRLGKAFRNPQNMGFGANCNIGATHASGDIFFFINQDVFAVKALSSGWDHILLDRFKDPKIGIIGTKLIYMNRHLQHAGIVFDANCQPHHRYINYKDHNYPLANIPGPIKAVTGAALAIRRDLWIGAGGFDHLRYLKSYFEDTDLCLKIHFYAQSIVWYEPSICYFHETGTSGGNQEHFRHNALKFKERWVDSGILQPDLAVVKEAFW